MRCVSGVIVGIALLFGTIGLAAATYLAVEMARNRFTSVGYLAIVLVLLAFSILVVRSTIPGARHVFSPRALKQGEK